MPIQISFLQTPVPSSADTQALYLHPLDEGKTMQMGRCIPDCTSEGDNLLQHFHSLTWWSLVPKLGVCKSTSGKKRTIPPSLKREHQLYKPLKP